MPRRILRDPALIVVRDHYKLNRFIDDRRKNRNRRRKYFTSIDEGKGLFERLWDHEASDDDLLYVLMRALQNDRTFRGHVRREATAITLTDPDLWRSICQAGSGAVLQQYVNAIDSGAWPEDNL